MLQSVVRSGKLVQQRAGARRMKLRRDTEPAPARPDHRAHRGRVAFDDQRVRAGGGSDANLYTGRVVSDERAQLVQDTAGVLVRNQTEVQSGSRLCRYRGYVARTIDVAALQRGDRERRSCSRALEW
jgi:hypothetical protein